MKTYKVIVREVWTQDVLIEAESEEEARKLVIAGEGDYVDNALFLDSTLDSDTWMVEEC
jgi:hypothetical protein